MLKKRRKKKLSSRVLNWGTITQDLQSEQGEHSLGACAMGPGLPATQSKKFRGHGPTVHCALTQIQPLRTGHGPPCSLRG